MSYGVVERETVMFDIHAIQKRVEEKLRVIYRDDDASNPRKDWDHTAIFACWHPRYNLGDKKIDHSGLTISTSPFSCRFDSGQVGWAYVTKESALLMGWTEPFTVDFEEVIKSEVEEYDRYLTGSVYGFVIEGTDGDVIDSCWSIFDTLDEVRKQCREQCDSIEDPATEQEANALASRATYAAGSWKGGES